MKKRIIFFVAFLGMLVTNSFGKDITIDTQGSQKLLMSINGVADITFSESPDQNIYIKDLVWTRITKNPMKIIRDKGLIIINQDASKEDPENTYETSFDILLPADIDLELKAGNVMLMGTISVNTVIINSGLLTFNGTLNSEKYARISGGNVSLYLDIEKCPDINITGSLLKGKVKVPSGTRLTGIPFWNQTLIIVNK